MTELTAIGTSRFLPGFALAGVRTVLAGDDVIEKIRECEGIVVVEERLLAGLEGGMREELSTSIEPIIIPLSDEGSDEIARLKRLVKDTLGVDLLK